MKILVLSDNHLHEKEVDNILRSETFDIAIHTGDSQMSESWIKKRFNYYVAGNNDDFFDPEELIVDLFGLKTLILHGHTRGLYVFTQNEPIKKIISKEHFDLIIHGHTHIFRNDDFNKTKVLCPGSTNLSRGPEGNGYITFEIVEKKIKNIMFKKI